MIARAALLSAVVLGSSAAGSTIPLDLEDLTQLSREMCGLLDGYLEAIPECPPGEDTPIRRWQLDSAWLRAEAVLAMVEDTASITATGTPSEWSAYMESCRRLMAVYGSVLSAYHGGLPDSAVAVRLEERLIRSCSLYARREAKLLELLEEGVQ